VKKITVLLLLMVLLVPSAAWGEDSYVVVEDDDPAPDVLFQARYMMRRMTDEEKLYQLFIVAPEDLTGEGRTVSLPAENALSARPVGGVMLFGQNMESARQVSALTAQLNAQAAQARLYPLFIAVEEEGGLLSRVANKLGYEMAPAPEEIGAAQDPEQARAAGRRIAAYLKPLGINLSLAPTADTVIDNPRVGVQTYGTDPALVSRMAQAMAEGLREGGVLPCYTHFPGHGSIEGTTVQNLSLTRTLNEMRVWEWIPFQDGIAGGIEMILVSHGQFRTVGEDLPASTSNRVINGLLRGELGFQGVVMTDSLRMAAVTSRYKTGQECVAALKAGADLLLLPPDLDKAVNALRAALQTGELTMARVEESVMRILAAKIKMSLIWEE